MAVIRQQPFDSQAVAARARLNRSRRATADVVPEMRHAVADYARSCGITGARLDGVRLAVSEAISNVVLHAYQNPPGDVHVSARVLGDELWVLVADDGRGHNASPLRPGLGWGLAFILDATDEFRLSARSGGGTEARMMFRLPPDAPSAERPAGDELPAG
ncbi:MAG: ATP-binding protein [Acidobacteriota bacterium]|nr:ATP-binding protein [Acidobacteriota bacterium]